jgi:flagellar basal-body rod protein FlgB
MISKLLFGNRSLALMKGGLDAGAQRMRVISENVANVATPGYQAKQVEFEELINAAGKAIELEQTRSGHIGGATGATDAVPAPKTSATGRPVPEGAVNNVDIEQELVLMKQNEIHFQALSQMLANRYKGLNDAIR